MKVLETKKIGFSKTENGKTFWVDFKKVGRTFF